MVLVRCSFLALLALPVGGCGSTATDGVPLADPAGPGCLEVDPDVVDLGEVYVGERRYLTVDVHNRCDVDAWVEQVEVLGGGEALRWEAWMGVRTVPAGGTSQITVSAEVFADFGTRRRDSLLLWGADDQAPLGQAALEVAVRPSRLFFESDPVTLGPLEDCRRVGAARLRSELPEAVRILAYEVMSPSQERFDTAAFEEEHGALPWTLDASAADEEPSWLDLELACTPEAQFQASAQLLVATDHPFFPQLIVEIVCESAGEACP